MEELPKKFIIPHIKPYDGTTDLEDHVDQYSQRLTLVSYPFNKHEACMYRGFCSTLVGPPLKWYLNLPEGQIASFAQLAYAFVEQFARSMKIIPTFDDLYRLWQKQGESLRSFLTRFNKEKLEIPRCLDEIAINAFCMALIPGSKLYGKLTRYPCKLFQEVQPKKSQQKQVSSEAPRYPRRDPKPIDFKKKPRSPEYNLVIPPNEVLSTLKKMGDVVRWPDKVHKPIDQRDTSKWCEFHNDYGHITNDCFTLKKEVIQLLKKGYYLKEEKQQWPKPKDEKKNRNHLPPKKMINVIFGRLEINGITHSSAKKHVKQTEHSEVWNDKSMVQFTRQVISFTDDDMTILLNPHDYALVITLQIANYEVKRIMIDDDNSANLLFMPTLQAMGLSEPNIIRGHIPLIGFNGEQQYTIGSIPLQVYTKGVNLHVRFNILDCQSTYHQVIRFPQEMEHKRYMGINVKQGTAMNKH
ncbi:uncharacterized protein LOC119985507 [Tripterygium wilfordii]|uniref:uncharacterized protein LOC119985507 n=1 Tax=Tripterygium wilfordii TaxID=458696 RepID=UPI0018F826E3|nr:uncharacterized protein LOC119985507 [Tripterygium wilfordii]